jgi:hypothetical protein
MVTAEAKPKAETTRPWHHFLDENVKALAETVSAEELERVKTRWHKNVFGFRQSTWKKIQRELASEYNIVVRDEEEPHWIEANGQAMFYTEEISSAREDKRDDKGKIISRKMVNKSGGWKPISLMATNASMIARAIEKGWRFREDIEVLIDFDMAQALLRGDRTGFEKPADPEHLYSCDRHAARMAHFVTWDAYVNHCVANREPLTEDFPEEILRLIEGNDYFCFACSVPFISARGASQHMRDAMKKGLGHLHPSLEGMEVKGNDK